MSKNKTPPVDKLKVSQLKKFAWEAINGLTRSESVVRFNSWTASCFLKPSLREKKYLFVLLIGKNVDKCLDNLIDKKILSEWSYATVFDARRCEQRDAFCTIEVIFRPPGDETSYELKRHYAVDQ